MKTKTRPYPKIKGFTLTEIMIVVAIIGILAALAIPNVLRGRDRAWVGQCQANMNSIDTACQMFFTEHRTWPAAGDLAAAGLDNYFPDTNGDGTGDLPVCSFGTGYNLVADPVTGGVRVNRGEHAH